MEPFLQFFFYYVTTKSYYLDEFTLVAANTEIGGGKGFTTSQQFATVYVQDLEINNWYWNLTCLLS